MEVNLPQNSRLRLRVSFQIPSRVGMAVIFKDRYSTE
jgi:hypothetical protein